MTNAELLDEIEESTAHLRGVQLELERSGGYINQLQGYSKADLESAADIHHSTIIAAVDALRKSLATKRSPGVVERLFARLTCKELYEAWPGKLKAIRG